MEERVLHWREQKRAAIGGLEAVSDGLMPAWMINRCGAAQIRGARADVLAAAGANSR